MPSSVSGTPISGIEVAERREHLIVGCVRAQDRGEHLLGGRLAVRAGDRDHHRSEALAPARPEPAQPAARLVDDEQRQRRRSRVVPIHHCAGGAALPCRFEEIMSIEVLAPDRDEQVRFREAAAVGRDAAQARVGADEAGVGSDRCFTQAHHRPAQRASAAERLRHRKMAASARR
jgi:hypothetical protein